MINAVVFDLDDTLYPEIEYVKSGFRAISKAFGDNRLSEKLYSLFEEDRKNVYQRAGLSKEQVEKCIEIYRNHKPDIRLSADNLNILKQLKNKKIKLGLITDGRPEGQRNKIEALGLYEYMDCIIVTDELGGARYRKPNPRAFELMKEKLGTRFSEMIYVGDNPQKDFIAPKALGMKTCCYFNKTGLYSNCCDDVEFLIDDLVKIMGIVDADC